MSADPAHRDRDLARAADAAWRDPLALAGPWAGAPVDPARLAWEEEGPFWELLGARGLTLLVTREYEHLLLALSAPGGRPLQTWLQVPHPSGLAVQEDPAGLTVHLAATRNPNQLVELRPVRRLLPRGDRDLPPLAGPLLLPAAARFLPGCLYLHDLAFVGGALHANAVAHDAVVRFAGGAWERVWWPRCLDEEPARFTRNHLQLNSIAAGPDLDGSYFAASAAAPGPQRPGDADFPVDGRGVIFSGRTREVVAGGLTRPHSTRLHEGRLWVDDSGYGRVGTVDLEAGRLEPVAALGSWTRGLCFRDGLAFVGTSRVLPRFAHYAPGLDVERARCGVAALDPASGEVLARLTWPRGDQVFAVEALPAALAIGLPGAEDGEARVPAPEGLFYAFDDAPEGS